jgi:hypothetical protein
MTETPTPDLELAKAESIDAAIHQAIGAASVCWENPAGAGVFLSERAHSIAQQLRADLRTRLAAGEAL